MGNQINTDKGDQVTAENTPVVEPGEVSGFYVDSVRQAPALNPAAVVVSRSAYAITLLAGFQAGWFGPLLPSIAQAQGFALERAGIMVSAVCAGGLISLAVSKPLMARLPELQITLLATALTTIGFIGLGTLGGLYLLTASALCYGMGVGLNSVASHILFPRYYPDKVASALSKLNVFFGVGALIGPVIVLTLLYFKAQYQTIFIGAGLLALAISANLALTLIGNRNKAATGGGEFAPTFKPAAFKTVMTHPILLALVAINFLYVGIETTLGAWTYTFLQRAENVDGAVASSAISMLWAGLTLGRMASARACLKVNPKYVTMAAMLILIAAIFAAATIHLGPFVALPMVLLIGFGLGPIFPTIIAQSATRFPLASSATTTVTLAAGNFGGVLLPWLAGYAIAWFGPVKFMLLVGAAAMFLPVLLGLALFRPGHRTELAD